MARPVREASLISADRAPLSGALATVTAVREVCPPGARYGPHRLPSLCLFLTESGNATVGADGRDLLHQPDGLVMVAPDTEFTEEIGTTAPWQVRYLLLEGPWIAAMTPRTFAHCPPPFEWHSVFQAVFAETFRGAQADPWTLLSACAELLGHMERLSVAPAHLPPASHALRRAAERLMAACPERSWSVPEMAAALQTSPRRFTYLIRAETGLAHATWIRRQRLTVARRLLEGGATVTAVAARTGFANPYHFSRVFKRETGTTPSEVRQQALGHGISGAPVGLPR